jgi:hypothetical protein
MILHIYDFSRMYFKLPAEAYFVLQSNFALAIMVFLTLNQLNVFIKECDLFLFLIDKCVI